MPIGIAPIPPWLHGQDPVANYAKGLELGQRAAAQQAQQLEAMQENQRKREEMANRTAMAKMELDAEIANQRQRAGQMQQEIEIKRQTQEAAARKAALQFQGQQKYQQVMSESLAGGKSPDEARRNAILEAAPLLFANQPTAIPQTIRALKPDQAPYVQKFEEGIPPAVMARGLPHWPSAASMASEFMPDVVSVDDPSNPGRKITIARAGKVVPPSLGELKMAEVVADRIKSNEKTLEDQRTLLSRLPKDSKMYAPIKEDVARLENKIKEDIAALQLTKQQSKELKVGDIEDGYRFNGRPSDPKSWEKVE